ncbi:DUF998 domain-containing protein [Streptomyces sp. NPDC057909]|uniref:DUF998 domain-containing protein n=1 Tax=Streptomyces sp. NPDC057909 TaxID=3346277 RepID=UPI0036ED26FC
MKTVPNHPARGAAHRKPIDKLAIVAFIGAFLFAFATIVGALITADYSTFRQEISALASQEAPHPVVMIIGFFGLSLALSATGAALWKEMPIRSGRVGAIFVLLAGFGVGIAGAAREDCEPAGLSGAAAACRAREETNSVSASHVLHNLVSLAAFLLAIAACFTLARAINRLGNRRLTFIARMVGLTSILLFAFIASGIFENFSGLVQRIFLLLTFGWLMVLPKLIRRHRSQSRRQQWLPQPTASRERKGGPTLEEQEVEGVAGGG